MSSRAVLSAVLIAAGLSIAPLAASAAWIPDGSDGGCGAVGGCAQWVVRRGTPGQQDFGHDAAFGPDGDRVYVTGQIHHGANDDPVLVAYDAGTGQVLWTTERVTDDPVDEGSRVRVTPDGKTVLATEYDPGSAAIVAYDADDGAIRWVVESSFVHADAALSPDGSTVHLAGAADLGASGAIRVLSLDVATGAVESNVTYVHPDGDPDDGHKPSFRYPRVAADGQRVVVTARVDEKTNGSADGIPGPVSPPDDLPGGITVGGGIGLIASGNGSDYNVATVAFDLQAGDVAWTSFHRNASNDTPTGIALDPVHGRVHVTGYTFRNGSGFDYLTATYDVATGAELWNATYDGPTGQQDASKTIGDPVVVDPADGTVYVTGGSTGAGMDVATVAYDAASGDQVWTSRLDLGGWDVAHSLDLGPEGEALHATGWTLGPRSYDFLAVAVDAGDGTVDHVRRWDGDAGVDQSFAGALSPAGDRVVLTGASQRTPGICLQDIHPVVPGECNTTMTTVALPVDPGPVAHVGSGI